MSGIPHPPGSGHDHVAPDQEYFLSLLGQHLVASLEGQDVYFRPFTGAGNQIWRAVRDNNRHISFQNQSNGAFLTRNAAGNIFAYPNDDGVDADRGFPVSTHVEGGSILSHVLDNVLKVVEASVNASGTFLRVGESAVQLGFHLLAEHLPIFRRFQWVIPGQLARSSAPYYNGSDAHQRIDSDAVQYLVERWIRSIISLNEFPLADDAVQLLTAAGIDYFHSRVPDYSPPSEEQMNDIYGRFNQPGRGPALVYCGYGHGRTGTVISGIQMLRGRRFLNGSFRENHVESKKQMDFLEDFQGKL